MHKGGRPVIYVPYKSENRLLEESIKNVYEKSGDEQIKESAKWIMAHVKSMTDGKNEDYYEEMEWRLVYDEQRTNNHFTRGVVNEVYRLKFSASDIKVIIFPDEKTKKLSLSNVEIKKQFFIHMPILATLEDCLNF